jgi:hypothetical protein
MVFRRAGDWHTPPTGCKPAEKDKVPGNFVRIKENLCQAATTIY